jgi:polyisoprenoid-binding protein YceI
MKRLILPAFAMLASPVAAAPAQYSLDPTHTVVMFDVMHLGFAPVLGVFGEVTGTFTYDDETQELSDVQVAINANSVQSFNARRDDHVKGGDFLDADVHPEITFAATSGTADSATSGTVTGDLTLLGQTHPVTLDVTLNKSGDYPFGHKSFVLGLSITGEIQRSVYGMDYAVSGDIVGDMVGVRIETEAVRAN